MVENNCKLSSHVFLGKQKKKQKKKVTLSNDVCANKERFCFVNAGKFFQEITISKILAQQTLSSNAVEPQPYLQLSIRNYIFGEIFVTFNFIVFLSTSFALVTQKYLRFTLLSKHKPYTYHKKNIDHLIVVFLLCRSEEIKPKASTSLATFSFRISIKLSIPSKRG